VLPLAFVLCCGLFGQVAGGCLVKGKPVTLGGTLSRVDENGYRQWIALRPTRPICALADPADQFDDPVDHVIQIQTFDGDRVDIRSRLNRLIGKNAALSGKLIEWHTGYQRAALLLDVRTVEATDADGMAALSIPDPPKATVREVAAYDITVRAGRSLTKEAREVGTDDRLSPVGDYAPHWVTGGDVVYVDCRDGYERKLISSTDQRGFCPDDDLCGFNAYPANTTVIKFHCAKKMR
jgi:hypothetical protein